MNKSPDLVTSLDHFIRAFSYPAQRGLLMKNIAEHPVHARAVRGNETVYFSFPYIKSLEAHVSEIPSASSTPTHRHSCEALFYVLSGSGYSMIRHEGQPEDRVTWEAGDLFCTPIHACHQHVNLDSAHPARYLEITTIPLMKSLGDWYIEAGDDKETGSTSSYDEAKRH